jgi:hypothetical protein
MPAQNFKWFFTPAGQNGKRSGPAVYDWIRQGKYP